MQERRRQDQINKQATWWPKFRAHPTFSTARTLKNLFGLLSPLLPSEAKETKSVLERFKGLRGFSFTKNFTFHNLSSE